jgi:hypothetical protein
MSRGDASQLREQDIRPLQAPPQMSITLLVPISRLTPIDRRRHYPGEPYRNAWCRRGACPKLSKPWLVISSIEVERGMIKLLQTAAANLLGHRSSFG